MRKERKEEISEILPLRSLRSLQLMNPPFDNSPFRDYFRTHAG
jgi:hypothetical protein